MMGGEIYTIEWDNVRPETISALQSGEARIINGVARDISDKYKIIQHIPFKRANISNLSNLAEAIKSFQDMQTVMLGLQAFSSMAIIGSVIISTVYLSRKLDRIQEKIEQIHKELRDQNLIYYAEKISIFFGTVEATKEIIYNSELVSENRDLIVFKLAELATLRNQLFSFLNNLIYACDSFTVEHERLALDFINMTLDLIPKGVFVESQAAYKIQKFLLGDNIRISSGDQYFHLLSNYKGWANAKYQSIVRGLESNTENNEVYSRNCSDIKKILDSSKNRLLLEYSI